MNISNASHRLSMLASLALVAVVGCSTPVAPVDETPLSKKSKTTATGWEVEPNDAPSTAGTALNTVTGEGRQGWIGSATDVDYYLVGSVPAGKTLTVNLSMPYGKNYDVALLASDGTTVLASGQTGLGGSESISYLNTSSTAQTYYLRVTSNDGSFSTTSPYTLVVGKVS